MHRPSFPAGQIPAQRIKALVLSVAAAKGPADARAFREELRLKETDLDDETRLFPLPVLHRALVLFEQRKLSLDDAADKLASAECIGAWSRLLRTTKGPAEALSTLDGSESEYGRTTRWETKTATESSWSGYVHIAHDPELESDGKLMAFRAAELATLPTLFGFERGNVTRGDASDSRSDASSNEFRVTWRLPNVRGVTTMMTICGAIAGAVFLQSLAFFGLKSSGPLHWLELAGITILCGVSGQFRERQRAREIAERAQAMRVVALERSLALREHRDEQGPLEGTVVAGQYRLGMRMGSGASGVIFEATRIGDDTPVAIKLLRAAAAHDVSASDRLRREAEALGLAWHPNVVEVYDHGHLADGTAYLVMELLKGDSLAARIRDEGNLKPEFVQEIAVQLADAFVAIHAAGVVHRDVKPSNVLLVESPDGEKAKIIDFGIARVEWEEMRITGTGIPLGTPGYMSPEQEMGTPVDARSDLYSFGALLYECFFGEPPPNDASRRFHIADAARDSGVHRFPLSPEWRAILERALAKNPDERYADARAMLTALKALATTRRGEASG